MKTQRINNIRNDFYIFIKKTMKQLILSFTFIFSSFLVLAQETKIDTPITTKSQLVINGKTIQYTAHTGYIQYKNTEGKHTANMFHVSYIKQNEPNKKNRPVTFVFNGGPGSSSVWLHMGAIGPRRIKMAADGNAIESPYAIIPNEYSWLDLTDLVFIDPVGSGFSRPVEGEKAEQFYGYDNDIKTVSEFIRLWTVQNNRWGSPKYIAGESYGTTRACGVTDYLMTEYGMYINGISLISAALDFQTLREFQNNDKPYIFNLPVYTYTAQFHKVFNDERNTDTLLVKKAETFAIQTYSVALLKGDLLSDEEAMKIAQELSYFTGISTETFLKHNLRIPSWMFRKLLLESRKQIIGRFDTRLTMPDPLQQRDFAAEDPSFTLINSAFATAFNEYVQTELQYTNELPFYTIGNVHPWKYGDGKYLNVTPQLRNSLYKNPYMKVWIANGKYDLATSYFGAEHAISQLNIPKELQKNIHWTYYNAGHMMYLLESELILLRKDAESFFKKD